VNHRPVESRTIHYALQEGYHNALMRGRYPVTVLFVELNPEGVDVNIHPAKREVRFHDEPRIRHFLVRAIYGALREFQAAPVPSTVPEPRGEREVAPDLPLPPLELAAAPQPALVGTLPIFTPQQESLTRQEPEAIGENFTMRFLGVALHCGGESRRTGID
jgi:DNA mismatch repair protein MutL